jgi:hypothetical protein
MATIGEITSSNSYTGNAALGGSVSQEYAIDSQPIQNLAYYTMLANKAEKEERLKRGQEAANEVAQLTSYDLSTAITKDRKQIQKEYDDLIEYARQNPSVLDYNENKDGYIEYHKKKNAFVNQLKGAKTRTVAYEKRKADIAADTNPRSKALREKQLEDIANGTDIYTPIPTEDEYDLTAPKIKPPTTVKFDVTRQDGMGVGSREVSLLNMKDINAQSVSIALGLQSDQLDINSPEFIALSPDAQKKKVEEFERRKASGRLIHVEMAGKYNEALAQYKDPNTGVVNGEQLQKNPLMVGVIKQFETYNRYVSTMKAQIKAGVFKDKAGKALTFGMNNLDEADYQTINWEDGVSPEELIKLDIMAQAPADSYKTDYKETNDDIERMNAQSARINANANAGELELKKKQWQASQQYGSETVKNGAMERARRIFGDIIKTGKANGQNSVILDEKALRSMNVEQLKYLGVTSVSEDGKPIFKDLKLEKGEVAAVEFVKDQNGNIVDATFRVLQNAKKNKSGTKWGGTFDPTRTTNLFNTATNVLNEELSKAGAKELNAYWGIDVTGATTTTTSGGGGSQSSSSQSSMSRKGKDGKTYTSTDGGTTWVAPDGSTVVLQSK